jgi:hypothetical protein
MAKELGPRKKPQAIQQYTSLNDKGTARSKGSNKQPIHPINYQSELPRNTPKGTVAWQNRNEQSIHQSEQHRSTRKRTADQKKQQSFNPRIQQPERQSNCWLRVASEQKSTANIRSSIGTKPLNQRKERKTADQTIR